MPHFTRIFLIVIQVEWSPRSYFRRIGSWLKSVQVFDNLVGCWIDFHRPLELLRHDMIPLLQLHFLSTATDFFDYYKCFNTILSRRVCLHIVTTSFLYCFGSACRWNSSPVFPSVKCHRCFFFTPVSNSKNIWMLRWTVIFKYFWVFSKCLNQSSTLSFSLNSLNFLHCQFPCGKPVYIHAPNKDLQSISKKLNKVYAKQFLTQF